MKVTVRTVFRRVMIAVLIVVNTTVLMRVVMSAQTQTMEPQPVVVGEHLEAGAELEAQLEGEVEGEGGEELEQQEWMVRGELERKRIARTHGQLLQTVRYICTQYINTRSNT